MRGGKAYKKGKKGTTTMTEEERLGRFSGRTEGQDYARVLRMLGDRRVLCFCNDGVERVCKIRGALCRGAKRQIIRVDDIVLISLRDFEDSSESDSGSDAEMMAAAVGPSAASRALVGDVLTKFSREHWREIRKEGDIHPQLFATAAGVGGEGGAVDFLFVSGAAAAAGAGGVAEPEEEVIAEKVKKVEPIPVGTGAGIVDDDSDFDVADI